MSGDYALIIAAAVGIVAMKWARHPNLRKRPGRASNISRSPLPVASGLIVSSTLAARAARWKLALTP
jgi:hypothetical protein